MSAVGQPVGRGHEQAPAVIGALMPGNHIQRGNLGGETRVVVAHGACGDEADHAPVVILADQGEEIRTAALQQADPDERPVFHRHAVQVTLRYDATVAAAPGIDMHPGDGGGVVDLRWTDGQHCSANPTG